MYRPSFSPLLFSLSSTALLVACRLMLDAPSDSLMYSTVHTSLYQFLSSILAWKDRKCNTCRTPYGCILPFRNENRGCKIRMYTTYCTCCTASVWMIIFSGQILDCDLSVTNRMFVACCGAVPWIEWCKL